MFKRIAPSILLFWFIVCPLANIVQVEALSSNDAKSILMDTTFYDQGCTASTDSENINGSVVAIGDSLLARVTQSGDLANQIKSKKYTDVTIDAQVNRSIYRGGTATTDNPSSSGLAAIENNSEKISSAGTILIVLGTNYDTNFDNGVKELIEKIRTLSPSARVFWINIVNTSNIASANGANTAITKYSTDTKYDYTIINWHNTVYKNGSADTSLLDGSGYHQSVTGVTKYVGLITNAFGEYTGSTETTDSNAAVEGTEQEQRAAIVWNQLRADGLTEEQAAGVLGNLQAESGIEPGREQNTPSGVVTKYMKIDGHTGYGIAQWTWITLQQSLHAAMVAAGKSDDTDINVQAKFLWESATKEVRTEMQKQTNIRGATTIWLTKYEKPANQGEDVINARTSMAERWFKKFTGREINTNDECEAETNIGVPNFIKMYEDASHKDLIDFMDQGPLKPKALVIHFTAGSGEGWALPNYWRGLNLSYHVGVQFSIGETGKVYQFFPLNDMRSTNHAVGMASIAMGIEITARDGMELINNKTQFASVVSTVKYLCDYYKMQCSDPKGEITNASVGETVGLVGHDEVPNNDHTDPDTNSGLSMCTGKAIDRKDASTHAYMLKLRQALGYSKFVNGSDKCAGNGEISDLL
jgi:hypothetical protein